MNDIRIELEKELKEEIRSMYLRDPNEEGYAAATTRTAQLYKLKIEEDSALRDFEIKKTEVELKKKELEGVKKDRIVRYCIDGAAIIVPLIFYGVWVSVGLKFEETGSFQSTIFKGLINRFKPTR